MIRVRVEAINGKGEAKEKGFEKKRKKRNIDKKSQLERERVKITPRECESYLL